MNLQKTFHAEPPGASVNTTLIVYVYSGNDPLYPDNLAFFLKHGVVHSHLVSYYIILQQGGWEGHDYNCNCTVGCPDQQLKCLCQCPFKVDQKDNIVLVHHANACYDMGSFGELLKMQDSLLNINLFNFFIIINSSVRGPFLPSYVSPSQWISALTSKLGPLVKLVGPAISCSGGKPHVQSYVVAFDRVGFEILFDAGVFSCYKTLSDDVLYSEIGGSTAILQHGYNIDSLMIRYARVDWHTVKNCNAGYNPGPQFMYDGISQSPFETIFIKVKSRFVRDGWNNVKDALRYDEWLSGRSIYLNNFDSIKKNAISSLSQIINVDCFNTTLYSLSNYDLSPLNLSKKQLLQHYTNYGQFEARPGVEYSCPGNVATV